MSETHLAGMLLTAVVLLPPTLILVIILWSAP